jgi:hypothetical protein
MKIDFCQSDFYFENLSSNQLIMAIKSPEKDFLNSASETIVPNDHAKGLLEKLAQNISGNLQMAIAAAGILLSPEAKAQQPASGAPSKKQCLIASYNSGSGLSGVTSLKLSCDGEPEKTIATINQGTKIQIL